MGNNLLVSIQEENLAARLAREWFKTPANESKYTTQLHEFTLAVLDRDKHLMTAFPELSDIQLLNDFPIIDTQITNNLFSALANQLANSISPSAVRGAVNTPYQLAYDMVALSIAIKLQHDNKLPISSTYEALKNGSLTENLVKQISGYSWLDPCVGTGVFPLAIMNLLLDNNGQDSVDLDICGWDIDPIALEASKIRLALKISKGDSATFEDAYESISTSFHLGSSLEQLGNQKDLFSENQKRLFDIVIGNPPYVKANRLTPVTKRSLEHTYPNIYTGSTDLYVYFIAAALNAVEAKSGVICFVSPAHFSRSNYGKLIREHISNNASLEVYLDFNELEVFQGVSSHICVYGISKQQNQSTLAYLFSSLSRSDYLIEGVKNFSTVPRGNIGAHAWNMHTYDVNEVIDSVFKNCLPLKGVVGNIYSGIKTGRQSVYAIKNELASELLKDTASRKFILPYIPPRQIRRWNTPTTNEYLIVIKRGERVPKESALMRYLLSNRESLESRDDVEKHEQWYSLRDCSYYDLFDEPKIVYPDISASNRFSLDMDGRYITDGAFFLPTDDPLMLGILNSSLAHFYFKLRLSGLGTAGNGGRIRFKKVYVEDFPIPNVTPENETIRNEIITLISDKREDFTEIQQALLDELVYNLYQVKPEIRTLVEEKNT